MEFQELEGRKVTLFGFSEFGFPVARQTTIREVEEMKNGYKKLIHRPKRKQRHFIKTVAPREELYVFDGWVDIKAEMFPEGQSMSRACFDEEYMEEGLKSTKHKPIMVINPRS